MKRQHKGRDKNRSREWWSNARIPKTKDARRKLTDEDRQAIKDMHRDGMSIRAIERTGICSRRMIQFVLFPERLEAVRRAKEARGGWKQYYTKEAHREYMRRHRDRLRKHGVTKDA